MKHSKRKLAVALVATVTMVTAMAGMAAALAVTNYEAEVTEGEIDLYDDEDQLIDTIDLGDDTDSCAPGDTAVTADGNSSGDVSVSTSSESAVRLLGIWYIVELGGSGSGSYSPDSGNFSISNVSTDWTADVHNVTQGGGHPCTRKGSHHCTITADDVVLSGLLTSANSDIHDLVSTDQATLNGSNQQGDVSAPCGFSPWTVLHNGSVDVRDLVVTEYDKIL